MTATAIAPTAPTTTRGRTPVSRSASGALARLPKADVEILGRTGALVTLTVAIADAEAWALRGMAEMPADHDGTPVKLAIAAPAKAAFLLIVQRARRAGAREVAVEATGWLATKRTRLDAFGAIRDEDLVEARSVATV